MLDPKSHKDGELETMKHASRKEEYYNSVEQILNLGHHPSDYLYHFPAFAGNLTLIRNLTLYELYKKTLGISGHIAEIGVYKGAGSLFFGKLVQIFEPNSLTMVHGFDHFMGTDSNTDSPLQVAGGNHSDETTVRELIRLQGLDGTVKIHNLDARKDFPAFFERYPHLRFKIVFLDSGTYEVTSEAIKAFWPRLNPGGVLILDQYNSEVAPGETRAVTELLPYEKVETMPGAWMPNAYIIKKGGD